MEEVQVIVASADVRGIALMSVAIGISHAAAAILLSRRTWFASLSSAKQSMTAQALVNVALAGSLCVMYASALGTFGISQLLNDAGAADRMFGAPETYANTLRLNFAMVLYECFFYVLFGKGLDLWAHHLLGVLILTLTLRSGQCGAYIAWAGTSEGTTVFLGLRTLMLESGMKKSPLYVANGLLLWLGFFGLRVVSLFGCTWRIARDLFVVLPETDAARVDAEAHPLLRHLCLGSAFFIWALSTWWFYKITLGVLDAVGLGKKTTMKSGDGEKQK